MADFISEPAFRAALAQRLTGCEAVRAVTGPGRSGAVAAVYASHLLGASFIPYGQPCPLHPLLVIDTAAQSGRTLRRAHRRYARLVPGAVLSLAVFNEPPRVRFWYEADAQVRDEEPEEEPEDEGDFCPGCNPEPTISELENGRCDSCGKDLFA